MLRAQWPRWLLPLLLLFPSLSFAASAPDTHSIDQIIQAFQTATHNWEPIIHRLTMGLFWGLVTISFTWSFIQIALKGGGLIDVTAELVTRVITVGVSLWLVNEAPNLARSLIESFQYVGNQLSGGAVKFSPGNILELAMNIISLVYDNTSKWQPINSIMFFMTALIILICFALIAMDMVVLIVSAYITVSGGIVMMGFLGSDWTREHAINYFTAVLGVALKMFVMQILISLGYGFIRDWCAGMDGNSDTLAYLALVGVSVVFYGMVREIPQIAASLASGRFTQAGGGIAGAVETAASVAAGAAMAATGIGAAGMDAYKDAMSGGGDQNTGGDDAMKRAIDTGPANPGTSTSAASAAATDGGGDDSASSPSRMAAVGAGMRGAAGALKSAATSSAKGATLGVANKTMLGRAMAQAGVNAGEDPSPEQKQKMHQFLMENMSSPPPAAANTARDDGNDLDNYRDNLDEEKHHHDG
ncbi:P-type conjugative transfer protein TrbL [Lelliottia aquatilis]|uniref:P-type conjugative transfer protein TrbL n=1 Tax=Lelliottia aquatilis TaxID=2080838 RepID=UPI001575EB62|nr:P-type conjugative transfer protein TrbL [Lelliottia aquatilis]NTZ47733.1 P-type conjugative transfer protein TrbL [Lelliottia aquatilis]